MSTAKYRPRKHVERAGIPFPVKAENRSLKAKRRGVPVLSQDDCTRLGVQLKTYLIAAKMRIPMARYGGDKAAKDQLDSFLDYIRYLEDNIPTKAK